MGGIYPHSRTRGIYDLSPYAGIGGPLIDKATDLMKQLDDEDMLALISMLNRLALKRK